MNPMNPWMPQVNSPFMPSGRAGLGGSQIPLPNDPLSRMVMSAGQIQQNQRMPAQNFRNPAAMMANAPPPVMQAIENQSGGVRPGAVPAMNAVEQARQNQAPPPGANTKDPRNAALAGYR